MQVNINSIRGSDMVEKNSEKMRCRKMIADCENCIYFSDCSKIEPGEDDSYPDDCLDFEFQEDED